jgi:hypothetical protein
MKKLMIVVVLLLLISTLLRFNKTYSVYEYIGLAIDKMGITQNTYNIRIDDKIEPYVYLYWVGENGTNDVDKLLLYHRTFYQRIPDNSYGKNRILIKTKSDSMLYDKIGILKLHAFAKHNYEINLSMNDTLLIVHWNIDNWYSKKISRTDTIVCKIMPKL